MKRKRRMSADQPPETQKCTNPADCHGAYPPDLRGRLHPWRMQFGANWIRDDPSGKVVNLPSASLLSCLYEEATSPGGRTKCEFDEQDLSQFATLLGQALAMVDQEQVNHLYFVWSLGSALDESLLERWLASVDPYVARGQVVWKTMPEIYDDYLAWEATHG